jgi:hypothetical protein
MKPPRHLGDLSEAEFEGAHEALVAWLTRVNVPGSILHEYSLYQALDDCWERAHRVQRRRMKARRRP